VDTYAELYPLLLHGDVDAIVAPVLQSEVTLGRNTHGVVRNGLLASFLLYHYLNRRHADLVPRIEQVLKDMLLDGTTARIRDATVTRLLSGTGVRR
jgi:polar amino acid transport system substrate-binding protein